MDHMMPSTYDQLSFQKKTSVKCDFEKKEENKRNYILLSHI